MEVTSALGRNFFYCNNRCGTTAWQSRPSATIRNAECVIENRVRNNVRAISYGKHVTS